MSILTTALNTLLRLYLSPPPPPSGLLGHCRRSFTSRFSAVCSYTTEGGLFVTADAQPVISAATHKDARKQKLREPQWFTHVDPPELLLLLLPPARSFCDFVGYRPQSVPETLAGVACADSYYTPQSDCPVSSSRHRLKLQSHIKPRDV